MQFAVKEQKPVIYNAGATKLLQFHFESGSLCFSMHWHERLEILRVKTGEIEYALGSQKGVLKEGQALIIPPRIAHYGRAKSDVIYDVLMFDLRSFYNETEVCKNTLTAIFEGGFEFDPKTQNPDVLDCIDSICLADSPESIEAVARVYLLLHTLISSGIITISKTVKKDAMRDIVEYIENEFDKELTTDSLCKKFGYSKEHFCRKFKKATGLSPITYLKIYRLERAFSLIKNSDSQICEIAERCGFLDNNYFTRCFTAHYGNPPTYYRKTGASARTLAG